MHCQNVKMLNMTICICSDSKAVALSSYTISSKLLHQCWLSLQDLSNNNKVRLFWVSGHCDIKKLIGWQEWARTPTSVDLSLKLNCQFQMSGIWPKQRPACRSSTSIRSGSTLLNPSIHTRFGNNTK
jgi:hypothetical protein